MADIADQTDKHDFTEEMLKRARAAGTQVVNRGKCLNCGEVVEHLYCDEFCKQDFEITQQRLKRTQA